MEEGMNPGDLHYRAFEWLLGEDTGASSKAICAHMLGLEVQRGCHPRDPDDFGRCYRLLRLMPEWRHRIGEMAKYGGEWVGLARHWAEIEDTFTMEDGHLRYAKRPKTYALMKRVMEEGEKEYLIDELRALVTRIATGGAVIVDRELLQKVIAELEKKE